MTRGGFDPLDARRAETMRLLSEPRDNPAGPWWFFVWLCVWLGLLAPIAVAALIVWRVFS